jgi:hypothetical protein
VTHIYALVTVKKKRVRDSLAKNAAQNSWSEDKLLDEIHKKQPKRKYGGTRPYVSDDLREALLKLQQRTIRWVRVVDGIRSRRGGKHPVAGAKTKGLGSQLDSAAKAMQKLEVLLQKELERNDRPDERATSA